MTSTKTMIKVTEKHIRKGQQGNAAKCPVALAVNERYPGLIAHVGTKYVRLVTFEDCETYSKLPRSARRFVRAFDRYPQTSSLIRPFNFFLSVSS